MVCSKKTAPEKEHPVELPRNHPDRIQITFDDRRLVANAGLHPGAAPRPARTRPAAPRGRCPGAGEHERQDDDAGGVCAGWGHCIVCCAPGGRPAPWAARSRRHSPSCAASGGAIRQLDRVSGPGSGFDLDSTICETYGLAKEGARHHGYTGKRGYHPLLAIAAGTGDVLMSRLREGRANTARGAVPAGDGGTGATPGPTDDSRYGPTRVLHSFVVDRQDGCRFSITIRCTISSRRYPKMPGRSLLDGRCRRCGRDHLHPLPGRGGLAPVRLIVRRVKPTPGSQLLRQIQLSWLHHRPGRGVARTGG